MARSPEGVSATDTLDRAEDVTCGPAWCDCDCDCDRACTPLWAGVTGPTTPGGTGGGDGDTGDEETGGGVWTAEDVYATTGPVVALET